MRVRDWMRPFVTTCMPDDGLDVAVNRMEDEGSGCVVAVDERRRPVGIVSEIDACLAVAKVGRPLQQIRVFEAISSPVASCRQDDDIGDAAARLRSLHVHRMPVVNRAGYLVGVLGVDDLDRMATRERDALAPPLRDRRIASAPVDALAY